MIFLRALGDDGMVGGGSMNMGLAKLKKFSCGCLTSANRLQRLTLVCSKT
jgi:hypothetical protein